MSHWKISSRTNFKFLKFAVSWIQFMSFFLSLCDCNFQTHGDIAPLIHYGMEAKPGQWPWHAMLEIVEGLCGGTFVDNNTILTAAHCAVIDASVRRENEILVFGGRKYSDAATINQQEFNISKIIIHPEYDSLSFANDIAILKLTSDIHITDFVRPVSIWKAVSDENQIFGSQGTVIGFGLDKDDEQSDTLQQATIPVLDTQTCVGYDNETYENRLTTKIYCAGGKDNVSACNGDSGGGMFFNLSDSWYLRGLVSFSAKRPNVEENLCDSSKPTVFTDVAKYRKWIMRYTNTKKWIKDLKPCNGTIEKDTECNAATRFEHGLLFWALVSKENVSIRRISLNDDTALNGREVLTSTYMNWLDKDCVQGRLYWTERQTQSIFSAKYDGTDKKEFITDGVDPLNFAVDSISRRLYWVDYEKKTIEVANMDNPDLRTTVIFNASVNDRIAVDPLQGKLFRTVGNRGIGWSNLDGSEPEMLLKTSGIKDITVSIATGELCYVNEDTSKIDCMDTRSKRIRTIVSNVTNTDYLAATDDIVFWSNHGSGTIESINQEGMRQKSLLKPNNATEYGSFLLTPVADVCPMFYSPCAIRNGGCPENTICLPYPRDLSGKICKSTKFSDQTEPSTIITTKPIIPNRSFQTKPTKWPWHATIHAGHLFCGGTFIDNNTVLTAAYCAVIDSSVGRETAIVVIGGRKYRDGIHHRIQKFDVSNIFIHPEYNSSSFANDIAILKLTSDIHITNYVRTVPIWKADNDEIQIFGSQGTVIGFGLDKDDEQSDTLQQATIPVLDTQTCVGYDNETYGKYLTTKMYCAGGKDNVSACIADSGSGMFFKMNDTWYLRGLATFSAKRPNVEENLCDSSKPTVFTDVTKYRKWIMRYTNTKKWIKDLKPCNGTIEKDTECNAATRFEHGLLFWALVSKENVSIRRISLNDDTALNGREVLTSTYMNWLDKDCVQGRLYWTERHTQSIFSAKYDGTDKKVFITMGVDPLNFAVDWISRRLYWVDYAKKTIEVASMDNPDLRATVIFNVSVNDRIAVDPLQGKLFRTVRTAGVRWSNLDGSESEMLLKTSGIKDITVSIATGELCYVNEDTSKIDCMDTRSKRIRTIVSNVTNTDYLAATDDIVFWSNHGSGTIESINQEGMRQKSLLKPNNATEYGSFLLTPVADVCPMFYSPCAIRNGGCPETTICLLHSRALSGKICKSTIF